MIIGDRIIHPKWGEMIVTDKRHKAVGNKIVFVGIDNHGTEHDLTGNEPTVDEAKIADKKDVEKRDEQTALKDIFSSVKKVEGKKGEKGDKGDSIRGFKGDKGDRGERGAAIKGDKGEIGRNGVDGRNGIDGVDGKNGIDGKDAKGESAFELAKKNGFKGTEKEWIASLEGKRGLKGKRGLVGLPGRGGGVRAIGSASDVKLTDIEDGQILIWNASAKQWRNGSLIAGNNITLDYSDGNITINSEGGTTETNSMIWQDGGNTVFQDGNNLIYN